MFNNYQRASQKYLWEMLQERYESNQHIIERVVSVIITEQDIKDFGKLIADLYDMGFQRATNQYKEHLERLGYVVSVSQKKTE